MIIETKLNRPQMRSTQLVQRPRLIHRLNEGLHCKLTLITAPAGYGKTTLLTEWTENLNASVAWVSLDEHDRDTSRFWSYTTASLKQAIPSFDDQAIFRFANSDQSGEAMIAALINRLNRLTEPVIIVWDDFHLVEELLMLKGVTYFLKHIPNHVHLYILSRTTPSIPTARIRAKGELNEVKTEDLRFSVEETAHYFSGNHQIFLSAQETETLFKQTEGWVSGMYLVALYLREKGDRKSILDGSLGKYRNISDYFLEEVFNNQTIEMQQFLLRTSILERMNSELCQAVTGIESCGECLWHLEQNNLFFVSIDQQRKWYRYHHLFRDFLQTKLKESKPEKIKSLQLIAGNWFEENGYKDEAMEYYLESKHYKKALILLEELIPLFIHSELGTLRRWFEAIPLALLFEKPSLLLNNLLSLLMWGETETVQEKIIWLEKQLIEKNIQIKDEDLDTFNEGFIMLQVITSFFIKDFEASIRQSENYVQIYPDGKFFYSFGMEGDFDVPNWSLMETIGNLKEREILIHRLLAIWSGTNHYYLEADFCIGYGDIMYEWNRLEEAETYWKRAKLLGEINQNNLIVSVSNLLLAKLYIAKNESEKVTDIFAQLDDDISQQKYPELYKYIKVYQAYLMLLQDQQTEAWLAHCDLKISDEIPSTMLLEYSIFARLLMEQDKSEEGERILKHLIRVAHASGRTGEHIRLLIQYSLLLEGEGKTNESIKNLEEALELAEQGHYIRTFIDAGKHCMKLLQLYLTKRQKNHIKPSRKISIKYVKQLLRLTHLWSGTPYGPVNQSNLLTAQETTILQLITTGLTNKEIASQLTISLSTVKTHINHIYGKLQVKNRMQAINRSKDLKIL